MLIAKPGAVTDSSVAAMTHVPKRRYRMHFRATSGIPASGSWNATAAISLLGLFSLELCRRLA
jgi:hypothetical protein